MRAIIIDDNEIFCEQFRTMLLERIGPTSLIMEIDICNNVQEILQSQEIYDIYFLDIVLPEIDGLQLLRLLKSRYIDAEFIFVSAYDSYMQEAFYVRPSAFVRKSRLEEDLTKLIKHLLQMAALRKETVLLQNNRTKLKIRPAEVLYCQSVEHYVWLYFAEGRGQDMVRAKLDVVEEALLSFDFIRIHQRYLVNLRYVYKLKDKNVILVNGKSLPLSRGMKGNAEKILMNWFARQKDQQVV